MEKANVTIWLEKEQIANLDQYAALFNCDRDVLIGEAIDRYLEQNQCQAAEISKAVAEADAGNFASEEDVENMFQELTE